MAQVAAQPKGLISAKLFYAIRTVETGGDANAVSKDGKSLGAYQITEPYWNAAVQRDSSLSAKGQKWDNCKGDLSYSEKVMQAYMERYASKGKLGHDPSDQDIARIHKGGPNGHKDKDTVQYWEKVKKSLY